MGHEKEKDLNTNPSSSYLLQFKCYETGTTRASTVPAPVAHACLDAAHAQVYFYFFFLLIFDSFNIWLIQRSDDFADPRDPRYGCNKSSVGTDSEAKLLN